LAAFFLVAFAVFLRVAFPAVVATFFLAAVVLFFAAGFRLALTIVVLVAFFLAGLFFTALLVEAFFVLAAFFNGFRVVLFFAVPPVRLLAAVVLFLAAVPFFLEVVVFRAFVLFGFTAVELLLPDVFFPAVFVLPPVFPAEVLLDAGFRAELFPDFDLPVVLFLRAADAELPPLVFLPVEVLFLGIGLFLLTQIHSISVFLFMW